jgi:hypothetical protein
MGVMTLKLGVNLWDVMVWVLKDVRRQQSDSSDIRVEKE